MSSREVENDDAVDCGLNREAQMIYGSKLREEYGRSYRSTVRVKSLR